MRSQENPLKIPLPHANQPVGVPPEEAESTARRGVARTSTTDRPPKPTAASKTPIPRGAARWRTGGRGGIDGPASSMPVSTDAPHTGWLCGERASWRRFAAGRHIRFRLMVDCGAPATTLPLDGRLRHRRQCLRRSVDFSGAPATMESINAVSVLARNVPRIGSTGIRARIRRVAARRGRGFGCVCGDRFHRAGWSGAQWPMASALRIFAL